MRNGIKVFSAFNGMGSAWMALDRLGAIVEKRFVSEINKYSNTINDHYWKDSVHLGDISKIKGKSIGEIDLFVAGSPCKGFSSSGKRLNFEDPQSKLFFHFLRLLDEIRPRYWMLENVKMAKKEWEDIITGYLGVPPKNINSNLVSAQNRDRLYWANFEIESPVDKKIKLDNILEDVDFINPAAIRGRRLNKATILGRRLNDKGKREDYNKSVPITQCLEVRATNTDKSNCLTTVAKDNVLTPLPPGRYPDCFNRKLPFRYYTVTESCRLQTVPDGFFNNLVSESQARRILGEGWTIDMIVNNLKSIIK